MKKFQKIAIIGTGLIGGSLALDIKKKGLAKVVAGISRKSSSVKRAIAKGAIDEGGTRLELIKGSDLIILAAPVDAIIKMAPSIAAIAGRDCLITDVASTKGLVVSSLCAEFKNYLGSHPIAGSEKRGIENSAAGLFKGSLCVLTPVHSTSAKSIGAIGAFWRAIGCKVISMDPKDHDKKFAFTSHLPHATAFCLMNSVPVDLLKFSAKGLKDTTRLASCDPQLWAEIFLTNIDNVVNALSSLRANLSAMELLIRSRNKSKLMRVLASAKKKRESLP